MGDWAIANLNELEDSASLPEVEARFARKSLGSRDLGVSLFSYAANFRSPSHTHRVQEEAYVVVAGSGRVRLDDEVRDLALWDVVRVAPEVVRGFEAGSDGLTLVAVGGPKPSEGDGVSSDAPWPEDA
jgi:quercetin dioxygenase-like cupin family protein